MTNAIPVHQIEDPQPKVPQTLVHVASFIVHVRPEGLSDAVSWLEQHPRVEIYTRSEEGKLAVVMESDHEQEVLNLLDEVVLRPGVLNAALIYHEIIDGEEPADEA